MTSYLEVEMDLRKAAEPQPVPNTSSRSLEDGDWDVGRSWGLARSSKMDRVFSARKRG